MPTVYHIPYECVEERKIGDMQGLQGKEGILVIMNLRAEAVLRLILLS